MDQSRVLATPAALRDLWRRQKEERDAADLAQARHDEQEQEQLRQESLAPDQRQAVAAPPASTGFCAALAASKDIAHHSPVWQATTANNFEVVGETEHSCSARVATRGTTCGDWCRGHGTDCAHGWVECADGTAAADCPTGCGQSVPQQICKCGPLAEQTASPEVQRWRDWLKTMKTQQIGLHKRHLQTRVAVKHIIEKHKRIKSSARFRSHRSRRGAGPDAAPAPLQEGLLIGGGATSPTGGAMEHMPPEDPLATAHQVAESVVAADGLPTQAGAAAAAVVLAHGGTPGQAGDAAGLAAGIASDKIARHLARRFRTADDDIRGGRIPSTDAYAPPEPHSPRFKSTLIDALDNAEAIADAAPLARSILGGPGLVTGAQIGTGKALPAAPR